MKLSLAKTWPLFSLLSLGACLPPLEIWFDIPLEETTGDSMSESETLSSSVPTSDASMPWTGGTDSGDSTSTSTTTTGEDDDTWASSPPGVLDVDFEEFDNLCKPPIADCDAKSTELDHALGLNCGDGGIETVDQALLHQGHGDSLAIIQGALGTTDTFAPRLGQRLLMLSTGTANHVYMTQTELLSDTECSEIGLPCPSTNHPGNFDLGELPAPLLSNPVECAGNVPMGGGDCSKTIDEQWLNVDPRVAHDYTALTFSAEVPGAAHELSVDAAFLSAEVPARAVEGPYNDIFVLWIESEYWTGNFAIHPKQERPFAAKALEYDHKDDETLKGWAFEGHGAMDWVTLSTPVTVGETITIVMALYDVADGDVDTAVLLDNVQWKCAPPNNFPPKAD